MAGKSFLVWLVLAVSLGFLLYFPFLALWIGSPLQAWQLVLLFNIFLPAALWWSCKKALLKPRVSEKGAKKAKTKAEKPKAKIEPNNLIKIPGLEARIPIWFISLFLGILVAYPSLKNFAFNFKMAADLGRPFFEAIFSSMFLLWGFGIFIVSYTYIKSRKSQEHPFIPFQIHAPVLGTFIGIIAAIHVLFMIFHSYVLPGSIAIASPGQDIYLSAFMLFLALASKIPTPVALELVFGLFLIQLVVILTVYLSRRDRGINHAVEQRLIAKNILVALAFYSVLFLLIPILFSPLSSVFGLLV